MSLADTGKAIGQVTTLLHYCLVDGTPLTVREGRPEPTSGSGYTNTLNLFLYDIEFDHTLRNQPLDEGQVPPLWLILRYLMTAFDVGGDSDSAQAHEYLGVALQALQKSSFLRVPDPLPPQPDKFTALRVNPEVLKITFDQSGPDLLSKLMQGSDEKYRCSVVFQVRPVMIVPGEPPAYSQLVGVDYTVDPNQPIDPTRREDVERVVDIEVFPTLGPILNELSPLKFEVNDTVTILGSDLNLVGLQVRLGNVVLSPTAQRLDLLECKVDEAMLYKTVKVGGAYVKQRTLISAGAHPVVVAQTLPNGRIRPSAPLTGCLLPSLTGEPQFNAIAGELRSVALAGSFLGGEDDDVVMALLRDGRAIGLFDDVATEATQTTLVVSLPDTVAPGTYRVLLRVNGQQARSSPEGTIS